MTMDEFLGLFNRWRVPNRWISSAESEEYLALVTYLVEHPYRPQYLV
jgi:hypothetical protein